MGMGGVSIGFERASEQSTQSKYQKFDCSQNSGIYQGAQINMANSAIYKKVLMFVLFVLFGLGGCMNAIADDDPCSTQNNSLEAAQCQIERLKHLETELNARYQEALEKLPDTNVWDARQTKDQLKKAQSAWRVYRDENCSYVGGLQGGSGRWVTIFAVDCDLEETEKRIDFFKHLPAGG